MKIIFLDIDGVISTHSSKMEAYRTQYECSSMQYQANHIDTKLVKNLKQLQGIMNAKIVISSAWRYSWSLNELRWFLQNRGNISPETVIATTLYRDDGSRGLEIREYLELHPEITDFIILDDDQDIEDAPELVPWWIRTKLEEGFTEEMLERALLTLR